MRRIAIFMAIAALALPAFAGKNHWGHHGLSVSIEDDDGPITECSQIRVRYEDRSVPVATEVVNVGSPKTLKVRSDRNGGVYVTGGTGGYSVKACKASALGSVSDIRVSYSGGELSSDRSDSNSSIVYFLVSAPRGASLDLGASNGAISLDRVDDVTVVARANNGPISVKDSSGTLDMSTVNGPIAFAGNDGTVKLRAQNGPISVKLSGTGWNGGSLDAETQNGPLSLKLPRGYRSGVLVESDGHGPISCRAEACRDVRRFSESGADERPRRIELGSGQRVITLSTNNGPVAVRETE
jgi:hypothetical protein